MWAGIQAHLFPKQARFEEAGFLFAGIDRDGETTALRALEWFAVPPEGFEEQSPYFLQLTDETKAGVIKRAHDLQSALIEVHSHPFQKVAEFSPSDLLGFSEFVPHVRWRLRRRPYAAIVVAGRTFDALAWAGETNEAGALAAVLAEGISLVSTGATLARAGGTNGW